jgi:hypothetical protein
MKEKITYVELDELKPFYFDLPASARREFEDMAGSNVFMDVVHLSEEEVDFLIENYAGKKEVEFKRLLNGGCFHFGKTFKLHNNDVLTEVNGGLLVSNKYDLEFFTMVYQTDGAAFTTSGKRDEYRIFIRPLSGKSVIKNPEDLHEHLGDFFEAIDMSMIPLEDKLDIKKDFLGRLFSYDVFNVVADPKDWAFYEILMHRWGKYSVVSKFLDAITGNKYHKRLVKKRFYSIDLEMHNGNNLYIRNGLSSSPEYRCFEIGFSGNFRICIENINTGDVVFDVVNRGVGENYFRLRPHDRATQAH